MKQPDDKQTLEIFPDSQPRRLGRPTTGKAKSAAERMRDYRKRKATEKPTAKPPAVAALDVEAKLEQLREINAALEIIVTSYEKEAAQHVEECRALNDQITRLMQTEAWLRHTIEIQAARIHDLESRLTRRKKL